jgi:hypothetical protein
MANNNRIYYAMQAVRMKPCVTTDGGASYVYGTEQLLRGVQSIGITSNFNLEQVYQLGQVELYDQVEEVPDIEVTISKVIDGTRLAYNIANDGSVANSSDGQTLSALTNRRCDVILGIWDDTDFVTSGNASYWVTCTGMYVSAVTYNFVTDGNFTEDLTLVGNHKKWKLATAPQGIGVSGEERRVARRWSLYNGTGDNTVLPSGNGEAAQLSGGIQGTWGSGLHVNSMTLSTTLGREAINELGRRTPYYRYISFPVEVTAELEVTATNGDNVDADDFETQTGCAAATASNLKNYEIKAVICNPSGTGAGTKYIVDLGTKNKLTSVNYTGGDTGGGNATVTYSYQTFNYFKVTSPAA